MTGPTEPPENEFTPPPVDNQQSADLPEQFTQYPTTFLSSLGRADMAGATPDEQAYLREQMYNGWIRPDEYDENGNRTYGPAERREARQAYENAANDIGDRAGGDIDTTFDWDAWREEYEEAAGY